MESPSKLPAISKENPADKTLLDPTPLLPNPASPNPSDSLDALFNMEKADLREVSPTLVRKKQGRDGDDVASDIPRTQHHCSTRNPRIGSGFNNKPEDLVQIIDEECPVGVGQ